jgi:hypothetical protein
VRVFLGVREGRRGESDLVSLFKDVCRMEERFREELKRYIRMPGTRRITPREIPPLITVSGNLPPTARNKMFNAVLVKKNFGGQRSMLTLAPTKSDSMTQNIRATETLLTSSDSRGSLVLGGLLENSKAVQFTAIVHEANNAQIVDFLKTYRWLETDYKFPERPATVGLQIEFMEKQRHGIVGWLIIAPQRKTSYGEPLAVAGLGSLSVKERHRDEGRGFRVYGEPHHRTVSAYLSGISPGSADLVQPNPLTLDLRNPHRGIFLLYPVRELPQDRISIGYELLFPENDLQYEVNFSVVRSGGNPPIVIQTAGTS